MHVYTFKVPVMESGRNKHISFFHVRFISTSSDNKMRSIHTLAVLTMQINVINRHGSIK